MTIDNELLAKFEGKCWHEPHEIYLTNNHTVATTPVQEHALCGCRYPEYPDYSASPDDRERLWLYLMGKEEMWASFRRWVVDAYCRRLDGDTVPFIPWLFSPLDGVPRWVSLLSEWLRLDETIERFGWEQCTEDNRPSDCMQDRDECRLQVGKMGDSSGKCCLGKIKAEWAKEE